MDIKLQPKLLRAIQEHEIDRIGGSSSVKVDLRIIATSNRNLLEAISQGIFREDLYFRLNIINIELPTLSDRKSDLAELSSNFIKKYAANNKIPAKTLSKAALDKMVSYSWPGNIRELENIIHRAVLLSDSQEISAQDINVDLKNHDVAGGPAADSEQQLIINTVSYCLGDLNHAANILGVSISMLQNKLALSTKP